jgi:hypothetical protein
MGRGRAVLPPMLGAYSVRAGVLRFEPQFPLERGVAYRAVFRPDRLPGRRGATAAPITADFQLPPRDTSPTTAVSHVYPSADVLPENLLKFYLHFSAPMRRGRSYEHIRLRDGSGREIELPFLELDEELWDPGLTRLTLFIDPGRIKRGVRPLEEVGPSLEAGKSYELVIDREWRDAAGNQLKETFRKVFKVGPPDREPPDPARWRVEPPREGTREPLAVIFPDPMDQALALRLIGVAESSGKAVGGAAALADGERRWTFTPRESWRRGSYRLVVQTTIEDLAGNNIGKPFDVDLSGGGSPPPAASAVTLTFDVR